MKFKLVQMSNLKLFRKLFFYFALCSIPFLLFNCQKGKSKSKIISKPISVLIVGGGSSHNFVKWYKNADSVTLSRDRLANVTYVGDPDSILIYIENTDVLFLSNNKPISNEVVRKAILDFADAGKGLLIAHAAMWYNWKDWPIYNKQIAGGGSRGHDKYGSFEVTVTAPEHPIMKGVEAKFTLKDERHYYIPDKEAFGIETLATSSVSTSEKVFPSVFIVKHPKARIVGLALGHDSESHNYVNYQVLLRNSIQWLAKK